MPAGQMEVQSCQVLTFILALSSSVLYRKTCSPIGSEEGQGGEGGRLRGTGGRKKGRGEMEGKHSGKEEEGIL